MHDIKKVRVEEMSKTNDHAQYKGHPTKVRAIKGLVIFNHWDVSVLKNNKHNEHVILWTCYQIKLAYSVIYRQYL